MLLVMNACIRLSTLFTYGPLSRSYAAGNGHEAVVKLLFEKDGIDLNSTSNSGRTALWCAASEGHEAVVKSLMQQDWSDLNSTSNYGRTAPSYATAEERAAAVLPLR